MARITVGIITPDEPRVQLREVEPDLQFFRDTVGGYIEHVTLVRGQFGMYVNEEGKILEPPLPVNPLATDLYMASLPDGAVGTIEGTVVLVGGPDAEGDDLSVPEPVIALLRGLKVPVE